MGASWVKANPSRGQAFQPDAVRAIMRQARNNPAPRLGPGTSTFGVGADEALLHSTVSTRRRARR